MDADEQRLMSRDASITALFGSTERTFRLGIKQLDALDEDFQLGPGEIAKRLAPGALLLQAGYKAHEVVAAGSGTWTRKLVRAVFDQGLRGAGVSAMEAGRILERDFDDEPLLEYLLPAYLIVMRCLVGVPDDPVGETSGEGTTTGQSPNLSPTDASGSPASTASARPSGGRSRKREKPASGSSTPPATG